MGEKEDESNVFIARRWLLGKGFSPCLVGLVGDHVKTPTGAGHTTRNCTSTFAFDAFDTS